MTDLHARVAALLAQDDAGREALQVSVSRCQSDWQQLQDCSDSDSRDEVQEELAQWIEQLATPPAAQGWRRWLPVRWRSARALPLLPIRELHAHGEHLAQRLQQRQQQLQTLALALQHSEQDLQDWCSAGAMALQQRVIPPTPASSPWTVDHDWLARRVDDLQRLLLVAVQQQQLLQLLQRNNQVLLTRLAEARELLLPLLARQHSMYVLQEQGADNHRLTRQMQALPAQLLQENQRLLQQGLRQHQQHLRHLAAELRQLRGEQRSRLQAVRARLKGDAV